MLSEVQEVYVRTNTFLVDAKRARTGMLKIVFTVPGSKGFGSYDSQSI